MMPSAMWIVKQTWDARGCRAAGLQAARAGLQAAGCGLQAAGCRMQGRVLRAACRVPRAARTGFQAAGCRPQAAGRRLQAARGVAGGVAGGVALEAHHDAAADCERGEGGGAPQEMAEPLVLSVPG